MGRLLPPDLALQDRRRAKYATIPGWNVHFYPTISGVTIHSTAQ